MMRETTAKAAIVDASQPGAAYTAAARFRQTVERQMSPCAGLSGGVEIFATEHGAAAVCAA
ncbi:MAG: hypothetical protein J6Y34_07525 [Bacteroidales bacterium]|nr:hypothetical protein [Bacteroidales bacterium]